ncbi:Uncharacterised protein [Lacrimispora sphenoides]|uniref:Carboxypeptidase regulatory-like domain-containing protein n=1 Tax=Lacrimispora sphenoides JCM 1415 TaxID=1297793 RepID=A0ABY1CAI9_9FIRM|nr:hypothetical protein SAMN02745906_2534 [[Clostridium] sphenoides JCM 1415]SUY51882.1 Uncharacterised protein [Lacrimispora sphenoides]
MQKGGSPLSGYTEIILSPKHFKNRDILKTTITIEKSDKVLLTGTIYNSRHEALEGAVIRVSKITGDDQRVSEGYVITNESGEFAIAVEKDKFACYQLDIFEPLLTT